MAQRGFNQSITPADVNGVLEANLQTQLYKYLLGLGHSPPLGL